MRKTQKTRPVRAPRETRGRTGALVGIVQGNLIVPFDAEEDALPVGSGSRHGAQDGYVVVAERARAGAKIVEVIGPVDAPGVDVEVIARRHHLRRQFTEAVRIHAARIPREIPPKDLAKRQRFDSPSPVTIDGETARDFDDAVAVEEAPQGGCRLYVHVADVSYYVKAGDPIDKEAKARGTSVYFPDRVFPMVPERLADDLCSLRPGEDRLVQTVIIEFDKRGEIVSTRFADGVIRSAARLTYTQVAELLDDGVVRAPITQEIAQMLRGAELLRAKLEIRRRARGSIDFDLPAPTILLDVEGVMTGIKIEPRNRAHRMIEEFMLAANEAVATWLSAHHVPCLFRVHESPDPVKIEGLAAFAASLGLTLKTKGGEVRSSDVRRLLEEAETLPALPVLTQIALRSMKQARYAPEDEGHFGLAAPHYLHFTSPIRRYPDLVAHRALRGARSKAKRTGTADLTELGESCSTLEREAESAERELVEWKKVKFLQDREGEEFDGLITGVARFGLFVQLAGGIGEGLVRVSRLGNEWFDFDPVRHEMRGSATGRTFRLGDAVRVSIDKVDAVLRRVDLSLLSEQGKVPERPRPAKGRRRRGARRGSRR